MQLKKFLIRSFIFAIVALICLAAVWLIICSTRHQLFRLPNNENIVFLGNSHIECAVNDTILKNSFNFARSSENMEQIYCKTKLLKRYNEQIDTIVIGYDNMLMSQNLNKGIQGVYSPYFYDAYNINDIVEIVSETSFDYVISHIHYPLHCEKIGQGLPAFYDSTINARNLSNLGRYEYLIRDKLEYDISRRNMIEEEPARVFDNLSIYFMNKTIEFCEQNNITIIFLFTPYHNSLQADTTYYNDFYRKNYESIVFYDMRKYNLPDSCFGDTHHLNHKGAKMFSQYFEKEVLHKHNYIE